LASLDLLRASATVLARKCVAGVVANVERCAAHVQDGTAALTALVGRLGHATCNDLAVAVARGEGNLRSLVVRRGLLTSEEYNQLTSPGRVNQLGHANKES
jgi:aspartate ammonia-lyase